MVATDRYAARDALELIVVDYEPLPPLIDASTALDPGAPVVRDELPGGNHIFDWTAGDKAATDAVFAAADVVVGCAMIYPRSHPAPLETCGAIADYDAVGRQADLVVDQPGPARPPPAVRGADRDPRAQGQDRLARPGRRLRRQGSRLPGLRLRRRRVDGDRAAGEVGGGPVGEPDVHRVRPRLPHARRDRRHRRRADPRAARAGARRSRRVQRGRAAVQVPGGLLPHLHRLLPDAGGVLRGHRRVHEQGAGRRRLLLLVPHHRGRVPGRAADRHAGPRARDGPGGAADAQPAAPRAVPLHDPVRLGVRLRRLPAGAAAGPGHGGLRRRSAASRRSGAPAASTWASG